MKFIGATETYDPCFVPDWDMRLLDANLIISKELTDGMIEMLVKNSSRVIFHHTITGNGGTIIEPGVKPAMVEFDQFEKLLAAGFPISHYVLRVDPIIPFTAGFRLIPNILSKYNDKAKNLKVTIRVRVSVIDLYPHVIERFNEIGIQVPWDTFHAPSELIFKISELFPRYENLKFEACAEPHLKVNQVSCASEEDLQILGVSGEYKSPIKKQRSLCNCLAKRQILQVPPRRCPHGCVYCYWKE